MSLPQRMESPGAAVVLQRPTIKGMLVNSHVDAVRRSLGSLGVEQLADRMGHPVDYRDLENVPLADEVRLIEHALDLLAPGAVSADQRSFEAGRLHFRNFTTTPWARILFTIFPRNFGYMITHARLIAERVFRGVRFTHDELGPGHVRVVMENTDYPLDHFRGLFQEWMAYFGLEGDVQAHDAGDRRYEYDIRWSAP